MAQKTKDKFAASVDDHAIEGVEILEGQSSFYAHGLVYIVLVFVFAGLIWSFFSKLDVIVTTQGRLTQEAGVKKIYSPADGELVESYISEGMPVKKDQVIARIKSPQAIGAATQAQQAYLRLQAAEKEKSAFPERMQLYNKQIESLNKELSLGEKELASVETLGLEQMSDSQKEKLRSARYKLEEAARAMKTARDLLDKYIRLSKTEGGGGVSKLQVQEKTDAYQQTVTAHREAISMYKGLEQEFSSQNITYQRQLEQINMKLVQLKLKLSEAVQQRDRAAEALEMQYQAALDAWQAASKVRFADLDKDNFLEIKSPIDGEVLGVNFSQAGEKIRSVTPVAAISPANSRKMLVIAIADKDRGLLNVGQPVKMKFRAFPFHRFGFIAGELEFLSTSAVQGPNNQPVYKGRVSLERDYFMSDGKRIPLRFGMTAIAEVLVQKRRVIDMVLDPFRKMKK